MILEIVNHEGLTCDVLLVNFKVVFYQSLHVTVFIHDLLRDLNLLSATVSETRWLPFFHLMIICDRFWFDFLDPIDCQGRLEFPLS